MRVGVRLSHYTWNMRECLEWASWRTTELVSNVLWAMIRGIPTTQNIGLASPILARELKSTALHEVKDHTVRQLLHLHVWGIRPTEVAEMVSLRPLHCASPGSLLLSRNAKENVACGIQAEVASLPEEVIRELDVHVAHV